MVKLIGIAITVSPNTTSRKAPIIKDAYIGKGHSINQLELKIGRKHAHGL